MILMNAEFITYVCRLYPFKSITTIKTPHKDLSKRPIRISLFYSLKNLNTRFLSYLSEFWSSFVDNISQVVMSKAQKSQHRLWPPFSILFSNQPLSLRLEVIMRPPMVKEYQDFETLPEFLQIDSLTIDDENRVSFFTNKLQ